MPVNIVATVEEYFFRIVSGTNKLCHKVEYHKGKMFLLKLLWVTQKHQVETYNNPINRAYEEQKKVEQIE